MRTLLYTGHDIAYDELAEITVPRMREYAKRHGYDFKHYIRPLIIVPKHGIYWTGVCGALKAFEDWYDRAIYLDVDQLITNYDKVPFGFAHGFWCSRDWGVDATEPWKFSACGFVVHRDCIPMLQTVLKMEPEWRDKPFPEQGPWQSVVGMIQKDCIVLPGQIENGRVKEVPEGLINICPRHVFNAVPEQVCPGHVPEPWAKGDLACHITMVSLERRVEIAQEILKEIGA